MKVLIGLVCIAGIAFVFGTLAQLLPLEPFHQICTNGVVCLFVGVHIGSSSNA